MSIKDQIPEDQKCWYAVVCKFRCEKRVTQALLAQGIEAYIPIQKKIRQYASRKKQSESVLINSHVFVCIDRSHYIAVLQHLHIYKFLNFSGVLNAIPPHEMDMMKRVVGEIENIELVEVGGYQIGDKVQVIGGELTGLEGELVEKTNYNFKITLASLGWGLTIYIDPKYLLKIGSKKMVA